MRKPFIANMHLNELHKSEQDKYMAKRLENAKPLVKTRCPESFIFYNTNFHRPGPQFSISKQYEILKDNKVLYNKLYNIDKYGHKKHLKQLKPIFEYTKRTMGGNKKREIIKVAQENLFMLKRLNERTSFYNVDKWNKDYETSQIYKKNHCMYTPIDFNKTQRYGYSQTWGIGNNLCQKSPTRKKFFSKTHYSNTDNDNTPNYKRFANSTKKRKKFEDFNYRDLLDDNKAKPEEEKQFKKISEIENVEKEKEQEEKNENDNENKAEEKQEENKEENNEVKNEEKNEEKEQESRNKDEENEEQKEQKQNNRDDKEESKEKEKSEEQKSN